MTSALLDTHAYVWAVTAPGRLGDRARELVEDATTGLVVSAATVWEMSTKHRTGRWPEVEPLLARHADVLSRLRAGALPIDHDDAALGGSLSWDHRDPFDRVLAAQALRRGLPLVTRDRVFSGVPGLRTVW
ncbi:type II toxin-antitoxin system VapC family toxin [Aquipuribacter sp. SD81]|uniref:type II toxin-antitoxin system VapC family toxin n=1 Tax=Aquipuribacter sp. SD81 TaxID=3127703 RepID=UPI0030185E0D